MAMGYSITLKSECSHIVTQTIVQLWPADFRNSWYHGLGRISQADFDFIVVIHIFLVAFCVLVVRMSI